MGWDRIRYSICCWLMVLKLVVGGVLSRRERGWVVDRDCRFLLHSRKERRDTVVVVAVVEWTDGLVVDD